MSSRIKKIKQLDSLRTIAALMVILYHFLREFSIGSFDFGKYGVEIFFMISGFLITSILLKQREADFSTWKKIKYFITKRALRLFPVYYIFLIFFTILSFFGMYIWNEGNGIYYYTYTANILFFFEGMQGVQLNHLWTLAVEEQFYLFWPFIILFFNYKYLKYFIVVLILSSLYFKSLPIENARMLTFWHFDTLGLGALLAYYLDTENSVSKGIHTFFKKIPPFGAILVVIGLTALAIHFHFHFAKMILVDLLALLLIIGCIIEFRSVFGKLMNSSVMIYLGKISYGLYIYHKPLPYFLKLGAEKLNITETNNYVLMIISLALTVLISHLSFNLIEQRFIKLKSKFDL